MTHILLITHDELLAHAYRAHLTKAGFAVMWCRTGREGLARARQSTPDLMLLDAMLPGLHGLDVLKWLREIPRLVPVHVVLLIEQTLAREVLDECILWGAGSYLMKDRCSLEELVAHLRSIPKTATPPTLSAATAVPTSVPK